MEDENVTWVSNAPRWVDLVDHYLELLMISPDNLETVRAHFLDVSKNADERNVFAAKLRNKGAGENGK